MRSLVLFFLLLMLVPLAQAQDVVTVDFYYPTAVTTATDPNNPNSIDNLFRRYAEEFEAQNPDIDINVVYTGSYTDTRTTIQTEFQGGGAGPDVAVMLTTDLYSFIEDGYIVPAQQFIDTMDNSAEFVGDFFPAFLTNSMDETGAIWSVPFQRSTPILFYNKDHFVEAGLDPNQPPRNREELVEMAQTLTAEDGSRWGLWLPTDGFPIWLFQSFVIADGQNLVDANPAQVFFNTPQSQDALDFILSLSSEYGVMPSGTLSWGDGPTIFTSGGASMLIHTTGSLTRILNEAPFEVGVGFLPLGPAGEDGLGYGTPTGGGNLYLFANSSPEEQEAAWKWIAFLSSPEIQADWGANTGYVAARQSAWTTEPLASLVEEAPQYQAARDQLVFADREFSSYRAIDIQNIINNTLTGVISGSMADVGTALSEAQAQIDSLLVEYQ
jgi:sn-glycerol 3-phosphate transport system substrate-binding protein